MDNKYNELLQRLYFLIQGLDMQVRASKGHYTRGILFAQAKIRYLADTAAINACDFSQVRYDKMISNIEDLIKDLAYDALRNRANYTQAVMDVNQELKNILREAK